MAKSYVLSIKVGKQCYRHIQISENLTLKKLHDIIQVSFDFDDDHLYAFFMNNKPWDRREKYICSRDDMDGARGYADKTKLSSLGLHKDMKFLYLFDFGDEWWFQIKVLKVLDEEIKDYDTLKSVGNVSQYGDEEEYDEDED